MEDNIDDLLDSITNNFFSQQYNRTNSMNPTNPTNPTSSTNPNPSMRFVNRQLDTIYETMINYNSNMLQYHTNIRDMIRLINANSMNYRLRVNESRQQQYQSRHNRQTRTTPRPNQNNSFLYSTWTLPLFNQPTRPSLTQQQIDQYTTTFTYSEQSQQHVRETRCPISLENFQHGDSLCQIIGCGHVFLKNNIINWFRRSHHCPICRYNVTSDNNNNGDSSNNNHSTTDNSGNIQNPYQNVEQEMYNLMQNFLDMTVASVGAPHDISINSIPLTTSYTFNDASAVTPSVTINDTSNNDNADIEGDLSVD